MARNYQDITGDKNPKYKNGFAAKGKRPSFYNTWQNMKSRCLRKTNPKYKAYGGRGITICDEWLNIEGFSSWAFSSGWQEGLSIDRINNYGNYEPSNCRWISVSENSRKKRTTKISFDQAKEIRERVLSGENEYDLASEYGVVHGTIWFIVKNFTHVPEGECTKAIKDRKNENP